MEKKSLRMFEDVLKAYGLNADEISMIPINQGLINQTWKLERGDDAFILQRINRQVFTTPEDVANNLAAVANYFQQHQPDYFFVAPVETSERQMAYFDEDGNYFRLFPFVKGAHSISTVQTPEQSYEAAKQFGRFAAKLSDFDGAQLKITIPGFHDLDLRYSQFLHALNFGNAVRKAEAAGLITALQQKDYLLNEYRNMKLNPEFKIRVMHHDTKISNVLFDEKDKGICVIDMDTIMPGYFISDVGDMMRTYLCPVSEEEQNFDLISIRKDYYDAIVRGYLEEMDTVLSTSEKQYFWFAGAFMMYMQALRFLTDYLNNDNYYGVNYPTHNLVRAANQLTLLQHMEQVKSGVMPNYSE